MKGFLYSRGNITLAKEELSQGQLRWSTDGYRTKDTDTGSLTNSNHSQAKPIMCMRKKGRQCAGVGGDGGRGMGGIPDDLRICSVSLQTAHLALRDRFYKKKQKFLK